MGLTFLFECEKYEGFIMNHHFSVPLHWRFQVLDMKHSKRFEFLARFGHSDEIRHPFDTS
ncbi:hypothetical protein OUZ56_033734 [Daphnia magna]|uniref:Uncharacterized protein n=1 Tax=Daphnia magna TaxID=35525 RepID=A0ABR0BB05_9CRUS|nr:hypothetical protein OUZ56_033734 [Daphnia magna]